MLSLRKILPLCLLLALVGCKRHQSVYLPFDDVSAAPRQSLRGAATQASEEGRMEVRMAYPCMENYTGEEDSARATAAQVFPKGVQSTFYSEDGSKVDVFLVADSAINFQKQKLMKFYRNVVVYDYRTLDTIYTDALYWNQETRKIYSDVYVRKVSPDLVLEGEGFDSDERMENVVLRKPRGVIR